MKQIVLIFSIPCIDYKGPTINIYTTGSYTFGGYNDQSWQAATGQNFYSSQAFLFKYVHHNHKFVT